MAQCSTRVPRDLDLAVLVDLEQFKTMDREAPHGYPAELNTAIMDHLKINRVDLTLLHQLIRRGVATYRENKIDFIDAWIMAFARQRAIILIYSYDKKHLDLGRTWKYCSRTNSI